MIFSNKNIPEESNVSYIKITEQNIHLKNEQLKTVSI